MYWKIQAGSMRERKNPKATLITGVRKKVKLMFILFLWWKLSINWQYIYKINRKLLNIKQSSLDYKEIEPSLNWRKSLLDNDTKNEGDGYLRVTIGHICVP